MQAMEPMRTLDMVKDLEVIVRTPFVNVPTS